MKLQKIFKILYQCFFENASKKRTPNSKTRMNLGLNNLLKHIDYITPRPLSMLSIAPAATAEPITPATLGPIACINKKL